MDDEAKARICVEREELLVTRLDENLLAHAAGMGDAFTVEDLHDLGRFIVMHGYLTEEHKFEESEVERLLRFRNPLEVATECVSLGVEIRSVDLNFYLERANPEEDYPLLPDVDAPAQEQEAEPARKSERRRPAHKAKER